MSMTRAEQVNMLEGRLTFLVQMLKDTDDETKDRLEKEIQVLKDEIAVIIREASDEETFFDGF